MPKKLSQTELELRREYYRLYYHKKQQAKWDAEVAKRLIPDNYRKIDLNI